MKDVLIVVTFTVAAGVFFALNTLDRGEFGGWVYTTTKSFPIFLLSFFSVILFGRETNVGQNTALAMLLSAAGDVFLSTRSVSLTNFVSGVVPFAVAHYFNIQTMAANGGLKYWPLGLAPLLALSAVVGVLTMGKFESLFVQIFLSGYAVVLTAACWLSLSHWHHNPDKLSGKLRALGYSVFVVSDTLLTVDYYVYAIARSQLYVMITYYVAQIFICMGNFYLDRELTSKKKSK